MTPEQAKTTLLRHSSIDDGLLGSLRPSRGLDQDDFHEIMAALRSLAPSLQAPFLDAEIVNALWGICHFARAWGVAPEGMLRANQLISPADSQRLENWIESLSSTVALLLDGCGIETAFADYDAVWNCPS